MLRNTLTGLDRKGLRRGLLVFFLALAIPTALLIQQSYSRLKWEVFHQHQLMADELSQRIDRRFLQLINSEQQRPFTDYSFLNVAGEASANFFQRSPLSHYPVESAIPGVIGYFQVDAAGSLMTPLIPELIEAADSYGIADKELAARIALQDKIQLILSQNQLLQSKDAQLPRLDKETAGEVLAEDEVKVSSIIEEKSVEADSFSDFSFSNNRGGVLSGNISAPSVQGQAAFDELKKSSPAKIARQKTKLGRLEDLDLASSFSQVGTKNQDDKKREQLELKAKRRPRTEKSVLPEAVMISKGKSDDRLYDLASPAEVAMSPAIKPLRINTFESEIDPFEFSQLDKHNFVLFRKVWRNNQRYIQGVLIEQQAFLKHIIHLSFAETALSNMSDLLVVYQGNVLEAFSGRLSRGYLSSSRELNGELLYQTRLSDPLSDMQLLFSITQLPVGPGGQVILWLTLVLGFVLFAGFYLMYRLGVSQIRLVNQQQDFVSAVSHELKTPLTSIRMYGEMLREGWASEEKKRTYYDFIFVESERLSRLINNVLLMAKLTRNKQQADLKKLTVAQLMDSIQSTVSTQITAAGFELNIHCDEQAGQARIQVDADWFTQIMINLVDNAIKFSAKADKKLIALNCQQLSNGSIQFKVRDYGPGIPRQQMKKIFKLFYRSENELTRETVGTGIGLALVHQMVVAMNGQIDIVNTQPGAEFILTFPAGKGP